MAVVPISKELAWTPGDQLWVVWPPKVSSWAKKMDWYVGFLIYREGLHVPMVQSSALKKVMSEWEIDFSDLGVPKDSPLLISPEGKLPCHYLVVLRAEEAPKANSLTSIKKIWRDLGRPSCRLFVPPQISIRDVETEWRNEACDLHLVLE